MEFILHSNCIPCFSRSLSIQNRKKSHPYRWLYIVEWCSRAIIYEHIFPPLNNNWLPEIDSQMKNNFFLQNNSKFAFRPIPTRRVLNRIHWIVLNAFSILLKAFWWNFNLYVKSNDICLICCTRLRCKYWL